jgi:hypothetical protein
MTRKINGILVKTDVSNIFCGQSTNVVSSAMHCNWNTILRIKLRIITLIRCNSTIFI